MDTRIYVMTHKTYTKPEDNMYISLGVGKILNNSLEYDGDDRGDNISEKNKSYCELTGIYWIWKNVTCDIVGICHYRRYFVKDENFLTQEYIEKVLNDFDVIVSRSSNTEFESLYEHYCKKHHGKDMDLCKTVLAQKCPEYLPAFDLCMQCNLFSLGNMMIARKELFDEYCNWLFPILEELESKIDISSYDDFQARVYGYLAERLLRVWLLNQPLKVKEEEVRMIDPKDSENAVKSVELKYRYTECILKDLVTLYKNGNYFDIEDISPLPIDLGDKIPVWVCWWQGEKDEPELVNMCLNSLQKNIPQTTARVHLITLENVLNYVSLPSWIITKFNQGKISMTHLSDILRMGLLYRYGGMWIDATYFISKPIPEEFFTGNRFFTLRTKQNLWRADIAGGRWSGNLMLGEKGNVLFRFALNALHLYWYQEDKMIDYFLIDDIIALAYDNITEVKNMIDACPYTNPNVFALKNILDKKYHGQIYEAMIKDTCFFKLSHRLNPVKETITGKKTYYGHLHDSIKM